MSDARYRSMLTMFNKCDPDFWKLPKEMLDAFFNRLYS